MLVFAGDDTPEHYQQVLRTVTYCDTSPTSAMPVGSAAWLALIRQIVKDGEGIERPRAVALIEQHAQLGAVEPGVLSDPQVGRLDARKPAVVWGKAWFLTRRCGTPMVAPPMAAHGIQRSRSTYR
ncbi:MAG: hypothetical protein JW741_08175 [Sedimentisphaerales bacterium]|nr:hypothetical protein [Sedimentisphaerales bacterium]